MTIIRLLLALLVLAGSLAAQASAAPAVAGEAPAKRVMVMLELGPEHFRSGSDYGGGYGDAIAEAARMRLARRIAQAHGLELLEAWPMRLVGVDCVVMQVRDGRSVEAVVDELRGEAGVAWSQPLNMFSVQGSAAEPMAYNDRLFHAQPAARYWQLAALHRMATGAGVTVAIIDSRVDARHPDLVGRIARSRNFAGGSDAAAESHGTGVAGIIAARPNNRVGIVGIAPDARILALRACWQQRPAATVCDTLTLAKALVHAIEQRADVINMSLAGPEDRLIAALLARAMQRGATVVAAIDGAASASSFPASVQGVVAVADERLPNLPAGGYRAPGRGVPTTEPEGQWQLVSGSSFAAAHMSGLAALLHQLGAADALHTASAPVGAKGLVDACRLLVRAATSGAGRCGATP